MTLERLSSSALCTIQDNGRPGYRALGIPPAGAMDVMAMRLANHLLNNQSNAPVLECLAGARFRVLSPTQIALTGWKHACAWLAKPGEIVEITAALSGVWHYIALPGGIDAPHWLRSASVCRRAGIDAAPEKDGRITGLGDPLGAWQTGIVRRYPTTPPAVTTENHTTPTAPIRVWPGPQWTQFPVRARKAFVTQAWQISPYSDRSGYRLEGESLAVPKEALLSEPIRIGAIQVPPNGQPIVCLNDGPTVGGYPKIAVIDPSDLIRLMQSRPGSTVRFTLAS